MTRGMAGDKLDLIICALKDSSDSAAEAAKSSASSAAMAAAAAKVVHDRLERIEMGVSKIPVIIERVDNLRDDVKELKTGLSENNRRTEFIEQKVAGSNGYHAAESRYSPMLTKAVIAIGLLAGGAGGWAGITAIIKLFM